MSLPVGWTGTAGTRGRGPEAHPPGPVVRSRHGHRTDITPKLDLVVIDCPDASELAGFYAGDLRTPDVDASERAVIAAGARKHEHQPSTEDGFRVLLDPAGHPSCLIRG